MLDLDPTTAKQSVNGNKKIKLKISKPLKELQRRRKDCLFYNCTGLPNMIYPNLIPIKDFVRDLVDVHISMTLHA